MATKEMTAAEKLAKLNEKTAEKTGASIVTGGTSSKKTDGSKFVYVNDLKRALEMSFATGENIILWGAGGHGKSEYTEYFFSQKGIEPFVKTMGSGTTTDSLFGGIDIKELNATGKLEYLVENSFMNHEYVVFEELLDAPDYILEQLKDIITSGKFRNGSQVFHIKTKLIICCTNKDRVEFAKNDSLKALMERFPLEYKVEWQQYTANTYEFMFNNVFGKPFKELSYILEKLAIAGTKVSPRTAVKTARILDQYKGDMTCLDFIADFAGKNKDLVQKEVAKYKTVRKIHELMEVIDNDMKECEAITIKSLSDVKAIKTLITKLNTNVGELKAKKVDDDLLRETTARVNKFEEFLKRKMKEVNDATTA